MAGRSTAAVAVAVLTIVAGCSAVFPAPPGPTDSPDRTPSATPTATREPTPTPAPGRIGREDGVSHDASLSITTTDGVDDDELAVTTSRTIARVETIRGVEFTGDVDVELVSRAEYRSRNVTFTAEGGRAADVRWEAAFLVGEEENASRVVASLFGGGVAGYYLPSEDRIVLVGDHVNTRTLVHELVHALQHRRGWTVGERATFDGRLAGRGLSEGEAIVVTRGYAGRCGEAWSCTSVQPSQPSNVDAVVNHPGVYLAYRAPYVAGPGFVHALRERGGWAAVAAAYGDPPASTRVLLSPDAYPADADVPRIPDRSGASWERYADSDSLGRATVHAAFWANRLIHRENDLIATDYRDGFTRGLVADRLVAYRKGDADGYVWRLRFVDAAAADSFRTGYRRLLVDRHDAERVADGVYVIDDGPFADAFRVSTVDNVVTIVNAPTPVVLDNIHADGEGGS